MTALGIDSGPATLSLLSGDHRLSIELPETEET